MPKFIALTTFITCIACAGFATTTAGLDVLLIIASMNLAVFFALLTID